MKKNIFLLECSGDFWVDVVKNLYATDKSINPVYWTGWYHIENLVKQEFAEVVWHDTADAKRNLFPKECQHFTNAAFTEVCQEIWREEGQVVYDMLNRFDHSRDFSFLERQQYFYEALIYWNALIDFYKPELVIFPCPPHVVYDYIVLALCRKKNIKTIMFDEATILPPYCFAISDYLESRRKYFSLESSNKEKDKKVNLIIEKIKSTYDNAKPIREIIAHKNLKKRSISQKFKEYMQYLAILIYESLNYVASKRKGLSKSKVNDSACFKEYNVSFKDSFTSALQISNSILQLIKERNLSEKRYDLYYSLCKEPEQNEKYIYLALAGQPERTSNPQGGVFAYQILIANIIVNSLPDGWVLYIKEHPNQFHPFMHVNMYRDENYYKLLSENKRIKLIRTNYDPFALIDNAKAVASISGTTGIEGIIRNKPALIFGEPWYIKCPGVFKINNLIECQKAISTILNNYRVNADIVIDYLNAIPFVTFEGLGDPLPNDYGVSKEDNAYNISVLILNALKK
jgi:hypothetical protein